MATSKEKRTGLRHTVKLFYDVQRLRLQAQGRLTPKAPGAEIQLDPGDLEILNSRFAELHRLEKTILKDVEGQLKQIDFYNAVLSDKTRYKGIGPTMAGVILSSFDIEREDTPSKMWAFAGLRPLPAMRCKVCNQIVEEVGQGPTATIYRHRQVRRRNGAEESEPKLPKCPKAGETLFPNDVYASGQAQHPTRGEKLPYNAWLRMKLVGVLAPVLLKVGSPWKKFYDDYKHRKESAGWGTSPAHRHQAAMRYMIKMILLDIWREWRAHEGMTVRPSYQEQYLGHVHGAATAVAADSTPPEAQAEIDAELETLNEG